MQTYLDHLNQDALNEQVEAIKKQLTDRQLIGVRDLTFSIETNAVIDGRNPLWYTNAYGIDCMCECSIDSITNVLKNY